MKVLIGKREKPVVGAGLRGMQFWAEKLGATMDAGPRRQFMMTCSNCGDRNVVTFSENVLTGEIFYEGPGECLNGHTLVANPPKKMLDQESIRELFG